MQGHNCRIECLRRYELLSVSEFGLGLVDKKERHNLIRLKRLWIISPEVIRVTGHAELIIQDEGHVVPIKYRILQKTELGVIFLVTLLAEH